MGEMRGAGTGLGTLGGALIMEGRRGALPGMGGATSITPIEEEGGREVQKWNRKS